MTDKISRCNSHSDLNASLEENFDRWIDNGIPLSHLFVKANSPFCDIEGQQHP